MYSIFKMKIRNPNTETRNKFQIRKVKFLNFFCLGHLDFEHLCLFRISDFVLWIYHFEEFRD
jgi:hypothetical protein